MEDTKLIFYGSHPFGFHIPKLKTLAETIQFQVVNRPLINTYQVYLKNGRGYGEVKIGKEDLIEANNLLKYNDRWMCVHGCLLYNLCGSTDLSDGNFEKNRRKTISGLISELDITAGLGTGVVIHPGTCKDKKRGIQLIAESIIECLTKPTAFSRTMAKELGISTEEYIQRRVIYMENCAGEGTKIPSTLDEIKNILDLIPENLKKQVRICIDTAHLFGKGDYDIRKVEEVKRFFSDFEKKIGKEYLVVCHMNDSLEALGSRKDRHASFGFGHIWKGLFNKGEMEIFRLGGIEIKEIECKVNPEALESFKLWNQMCIDWGVRLVGEPPDPNIISWGGWMSVFEEIIIS